MVVDEDKEYFGVESGGICIITEKFSVLRSNKRKKHRRKKHKRKMKCPRRRFGRRRMRRIKKMRGKPNFNALEASLEFIDQSKFDPEEDTFMFGDNMW